MALVPNFTASQNYLVPSTILLTDTSTGSDTNIVTRQVFVTDAFGNSLANGTNWALANSTISLAILTQDTAPVVTVVWLDINNNVLYTLTQSFCFDSFGRQFFYNLVQLQALNPNIPADTNYNSNMALFYTYIVGAENAVLVNSDISGAQDLLNKETYMQNQQQLFF